MADPLRVEAMTIRDDRIIVVGSLEDCRTVAGADRVEHDHAGRTLIPGFVDAHCHPLMLGQTQSWLDVSPAVAPSIPALIARLKDQARRLPPGVPLRAFGYDYRRLDERRHPRARDLDHAATDRAIYVMIVSSALLDEVLQLGLVGRLGDERLAFTGIKLYADGALGGLTAYFPDGYVSEPDNHGVLYHEPDEFRALVSRAHRAGLQTGTHAQSPTAIGMVIDALDAAQREWPRPDMRHAIEHCGLPSDDEIARMARAGIVPVSQPQHHRSFGDGVARTVGA